MRPLEDGERGSGVREQPRRRIGARDVAEQRAVGAARGIEQQGQMRGERYRVGTGGDEEREALPGDEGMALRGIRRVEVLRHVHELAPRRPLAYTARRGAPMTTRLYLDDPYLREFDATVLASADGWCELSRSAFYPGGGGQPADRGRLVLGSAELEVIEVREEADGRLWHRVERALEPGSAVRGTLDWPYRYALMRAHALMHVVNTVARRDFDGLITGVQLGAERSRIDFRLATRRREAAAELEARVNAALAEPRAIASSSVSEAEFHARPELIRTLNVRPPGVEGLAPLRPCSSSTNP